MDQGPLFQAGSTTSGIAAWMCPGRGRPSASNAGVAGLVPFTDYIINPFLNDWSNAGANNNCAVKDNRRSLVGITDGSSNTIFFGHGQISTGDYNSTTVVANSYINNALLV